MHVIISYDAEKDAENLVKTTRSRNDPSLTAVAREYVARYGEEFTPGKALEFVRGYVDENGMDMERIAAAFTERWEPIEGEFVRRTEEWFGVALPQENIAAYLTVNTRSTYSVRSGYFFVSTAAKNPHASIMHELLHFYTFHRFRESLEAVGISKEGYNDIKEALTELLNVAYADLMDGAVDRGYPQHRPLRELVRSEWERFHDVARVVNALADAVSSR